MSPTIRRGTAALALAALAACSSSTAPPGSGAPNIVPIAPSVQFVATTTSFYAYTDEDSEAQLFTKNGDGSGRKFLEFKVPAGSLAARPNGSPFPTTRDSVLITISLTDPTKLLFEFQPSGLTFKPAKPATLEINYAGATRGDYNGDGRDDDEDNSIASKLAIWKQELPIDPFVKQQSSLFIDTGDCSLNVVGFTRFAIAY